MKITADFINELKRRNRIEDIVSQQVSLKRAGSNLVGLCPFHNEKTPSFTVFLNDQSYFCFGCENGGDVINYVMQINNYTYPDAIDYLCKRSGMQSPDMSNIDSNSTELRQKVYAINNEAAHYFYNSLMDKNNTEARKYVFEERKLSQNIVTHFGIGYCPKNSNDFIEHMKSCGYTVDDLLESKLCTTNSRNETFSFFHNRIIFPIVDTSGNVIAFGGRAIDNSPRKYMNSTDTPVFKKSKNLFGLNFARKSGKESIILCEGYMDVVGFNKAGLSNAVATLGTALTDEQANLLSRYTKKIILSYDNDTAGQNATKRAIPMLAKAGLDVVILRLEGAKDPDEYVKKFGNQALIDAVNNSIGKINFIVESIIEKYNLLNSDEKAKAAKELCQAASEQDSNIDRNIIINEIVKRLQLDRRMVTSEVDRYVAIRARKNKKEEKNKALSKLAGYQDGVNPDYAKNVKASRIEETILGMLINYPEMLEKVRNETYKLSDTDFVTNFGKKLFRRLIKEDFITFSTFLDEFTQEEVSRIKKISNSRMDKTDNTEIALLMNIDLLKSETNKQSLEETIRNKRKNQKGE